MSASYRTTPACGKKRSRTRKARTSAFHGADTPSSDDGVLIDLDTFFNAYRLKGAGTTDGCQLTREYLTEKLAETNIVSRLESGETFGPEEVVEALIIKLGRDRAVLRPEGITDEVWGDDWLDLIQFTLLSYAIELTAVEQSQSAAITRPFGLDKKGAAGAVGRGLVAGKIGDWLGLPATPTKAIPGSICASVILFGYQFDLAVDTPLINRHFVDPTDPVNATSGNVLLLRSWANRSNSACASGIVALQYACDAWS